MSDLIQRADAGVGRYVGDDVTPREKPALCVECDPTGRWWHVRARGLGLRNVGADAADTYGILRVRVAENVGDDDFPDVSGTVEVFEDDLCFVPDFPFRPAVLFRAILDMRGVLQTTPIPVLTCEFSLPEKEGAAPARVVRVYPSPDVLPENLLRFYVQFSAPMRRGFAERHIELRGQDGRAVPDALYRAPVELWDPSMTCLTVLLDPGRLKRGVGPNRELGSPLQAGERYTLSIGAGMVDAGGYDLQDGFAKSFCAAEPVREPLDIEAWTIGRPAAGTYEPLEVAFPWPLDWAQLWRGIAVMSSSGEPLDGAIDIDSEETRWRFTPRDPWSAGEYRVCVSPTLEDFCGNTLTGPFDGPFRSVEEILREGAMRSIYFMV